MILLLLFFAPILIGDQTYSFYDITFLTYPSRYFLRETFLQGALPLWIPHVHHGEPFLSELYPAVFYPLNLFLFLPDFITGMNWIYGFHFFLLAAGVFLLARQWGLSPEAGVCAAVTAMVSGFFLSSVVVHNYFLANCWFPLILYAFERFWHSGGRGWFLAALAALTIQTLAGMPASSLLTTLVLSAYAVFAGPRGAGRWRLAARRAAAAVAATLLCLGLAAPQLLPTYNLVPQSQRQGGLPFDQHATWSIEPTQAAEMLLPQDFRDLMNRPFDHAKGHPYQEPVGLLVTIYMGLLPLLVLALVLPGDRADSGARFWAAVFWVGLFFGLGKHNPLYEPLYSILPILKSLRYPEKFFFLCALGLIFLTAYGVDALAGRRKTWPLPGRTLFIRWLGLALGVGLVAVLRPYRDPVPALMVLLALGAVLGLHRRGWLAARTMTLALLGLILLDLGYQNYKIPPMVPREIYQKPPLLLGAFPEIKEPCRLYSGQIQNEPAGNNFPPTPNPAVQILTGMELMMPWTGLMWGQEYADGLPGLGLEMRDSWLWDEMLIKSPPEKRIRMLERSNVCFWVDHDTPLLFFENKTPVISPHRVKRLGHPLPRAFVVNAARRGKSPYLLNTYYAPEFDPLREVLLEEPVQIEARPDFQGRVGEIQYAPNRVRLETFQNADGVLVLLDSFSPGWEVTVDGTPRPVLRANHFFRGVRLEPGRHDVEFVYRPPGLETGIWIAGVSLLLTGGLLWAGAPLKWLAGPPPDRTPPGES